MNQQTDTTTINDILAVAAGQKEFKFLLELDIESMAYLCGGALIVGIILIFISKKLIK